MKDITTSGPEDLKSVHTRQILAGQEQSLVEKIPLDWTGPALGRRVALREGHLWPRLKMLPPQPKKSQLYREKCSHGCHAQHRMLRAWYLFHCVMKDPPFGSIILGTIDADLINEALISKLLPIQISNACSSGSFFPICENHFRNTYTLLHFQWKQSVWHHVVVFLYVETRWLKPPNKRKEYVHTY